MKIELSKGGHDLPQFRERIGIFRDRSHAGEILADMLAPYIREAGIVMGIPAGGVPVAAVVSNRLKIPLDLAVVSKITLPWNTEVGYGAIAFDGTVRLNKSLMSRIRLSESEVQAGIEKTTEKINRRMRELRGIRLFPNLSENIVILVDDGLASGFTMQVAVEALINSGAERLIVAVPTAHQESIAPAAERVAAVFCPNIRSGMRYAVADAYKRWSDVKETELIRILQGSEWFPNRE